MQKLNRKTVQNLNPRPIKVLQFGTGNFLRGFIDWVIDILNEQSDFNGDVQIIQPHGKSPHRELINQEGLYHVLIRGFQHGKVVKGHRLITCVQSTINPYLEYQEYLNLADNPDLQFVFSNTTEAGIYVDDSDMDYQSCPRSFPGKLTALLYRRFTTFSGEKDKGLTIIPCELIENNGGKLKATVLQYSRQWHLSEDFERWVESSLTFCNTLVDRIVPGFPDENSGEIQGELGFEDKLMVVAEPFHFWAIEGPESLKETFPVGKTKGLDVEFVDDLTPYRERKVRILNGAHTALVPLAYLRGLRTVREAVEDPFMGEFLETAIQQEIIPTLNLPEEELKEFANSVIERFKNPFIKHQLSAIALNSISKFKVRVLPSLLEYVKKKGTLPTHLVQSLAALIVFYKGRYNGEDLPVKDTMEIMEFFQNTWKDTSTNELVKAVLANKTLWEEDLNKINGLEEKLAEEINLLLKQEDNQ